MEARTGATGSWGLQLLTRTPPTLQLRHAECSVCNLAEAVGLEPPHQLLGASPNFKNQTSRWWTASAPRFLRRLASPAFWGKDSPSNFFVEQALPHRRFPDLRFTTPARSIPSGHQSRAMATFGLITCVSPSSAHTHPKLDSYQESYQAWRHAPGQPALKGFSYSHAVIIRPDMWRISPLNHEKPALILATKPGPPLGCNTPHQKR